LRSSSRRTSPPLRGPSFGLEAPARSPRAPPPLSGESSGIDQSELRPPPGLHRGQQAPCFPMRDRRCSTRLLRDQALATYGRDSQEQRRCPKRQAPLPSATSDVGSMPRQTVQVRLRRRDPRRSSRRARRQRKIPAQEDRQSMALPQRVWRPPQRIRSLISRQTRLVVAAVRGELRDQPAEELLRAPRLHVDAARPG
jgi:hypothetical protein